MEYQKLTKVLKNSQQNDSETVPNENNKKYLKKDVYIQKKDKKLLIIFILIYQYNNRISKNDKLVR